MMLKMGQDLLQEARTFLDDAIDAYEVSGSYLYALAGGACARAPLRSLFWFEESDNYACENLKSKV